MIWKNEILKRHLRLSYLIYLLYIILLIYVYIYVEIYKKTKITLNSCKYNYLYLLSNERIFSYFNWQNYILIFSGLYNDIFYNQLHLLYH